MEIKNPEMAEVAVRMNRATKSLASGFAAMAHAAAEAGKAIQEFRVACYPDVPGDDHPIVKQMRAVAEAEVRVWF